jgi:hypothetical protein
MEVYMNRIPKAGYTKEFRDEAVKLAMTDGVGVSEAARRLSISMKTVANPGASMHGLWTWAIGQ